jgi:hypothetical protein
MSTIEIDKLIWSKKYADYRMSFLDSSSESIIQRKALEQELEDTFTHELASDFATLTKIVLSELLLENDALPIVRTKINRDFILRFSKDQSKLNFFIKNLIQSELNNLTEYLLKNEEYELLLLLPKTK